MRRVSSGGRTDKRIAMVVAMALLGAAAPQVRTAWEVRLTAIDGAPLPLSAYRGKVLLVVNTASFCGFTPQYAGLQKLQSDYAKAGFTVIGVPSGDFGGQEYDANGKIKEFCQTKFGINFPLAEKDKVTGAHANPFFRWAADTLPVNNVPKWNFHKFLVGRDGRLIAGFPSDVPPESPKLKGAIESAIAAKG